jgi:DNA-damage-inducible protein J
MLLKGGCDMAQINFRMDDNLKEEADKLFKSLGMSLSAAVNIFISQAVREGGMPFAISTKTGSPAHDMANSKTTRQPAKAKGKGKTAPEAMALPNRAERKERATPQKLERL